MTLSDTVQYAQIISAIFISISSVIALLVYVNTKRADKKRATLEMVNRSFLDKNSTEKYDKFKNLVRRDQDTNDQFVLRQLVEYSKHNEKERNILIDQLNIYELVSLGIRRRLFDESFYKLWFHRQFTKDYESCSELIAEIQKTKPSTYCEFKNLAEKWEKSKHPVTQPNRLKLLYWAATKNINELSKTRN